MHNCPLGCLVTLYCTTDFSEFNKSLTLRFDIFDLKMSMREQRTTSSARILDAAARYRRQKKALEALEQDNFHDEPHADLGRVH